MEQVVLLPSGKEIVFYHTIADFNAKHFVEKLLSKYSFDRCECLLVFKEGVDVGGLKTPSATPFF